MNRRQKRGALSLQARCNELHSTCHFLALGLIFLVFYHMIEQSAIMKRALIGYVSRIRGLYLRAGAYKMGEGFILEFYGTPSKITCSETQRTLRSFPKEPEKTNGGSLSMF